MKYSDAAFDHPNVPSPVAQLKTNSLLLVQPLEVHPDTLHKLTLPPAHTQTMLPTNGLKLNLSPLMQPPPLHCLQHRLIHIIPKHQWLRHPCRLGDPHRFRAGGQNQKWPTSGQIGYVTPAVSGIPTASERGAKSEVAHKWAKWLPHPCRLGDPHRFRAGGKIRSGAQKRAGIAA